MRLPFGKAGRRTPFKGPTYDPRIFVSTDASQYAIDDFMIPLTILSGNGKTPVFDYFPDCAPPGPSYMIPTNGFGLLAPSSTPDPLYPPIYNPQTAETYLLEQ